MIGNYKKSLIEPLIGEELHIFHSNEDIDQLSKNIVKIIQDKLHGCYLLGGFRGTGKTSFLNLCCAKFNEKDIIKIKLDCNKLIEIGNFLFFFIKELVKIVDSISIPEQLKVEILKLQEQISYKNIDRKSQISINKILHNNLSEKSQNDKATVSFTLLDKLFNLSTGLESLYKNKEEENASIENSQLVELEVRNDEFILVDKLSDLLRRLAVENYQLILVIDEIDKQGDIFLQELFSKYKNLFINSHLISFFVVDQNQYQNIVFSSDLDDGLKTYFTRLFYLPTFSLEDIQNYLYREFQVKNMSECYKAAYLTNGVIRKINTFNYLEDDYNNYTMHKADLYFKLLKIPEFSRYKSIYITDKCKFIVKDFIELLFYRKKLYMQQVVEVFREKFNNHNIPISPEILSLSFLDIIKNNDNFKVEDSSTIEESTIELKTKLHNPHFIECNEKINPGKELIDYHRINTSILKIKSNPIKIVERDYQGFEHFIRMIETNYRSVENIILVKKISDFNGIEVENYSAILILEKPIGHIIYFVEECSFSYEGPPAEAELLNFMKENNIKVILIETDDEPINKNLQFILEQADKKIYGEF
ncbi:P-loop NTPase fold protein [Paenibacillus antibioticophila]|uniref:P-loop NTPase fold protein n=1 Tax=Paenibacillus antibioticophila TaxID=1274374 RepID=UPI0005CB5A6F|nr:P-loop NTPase fold protein [Paenibacillus antibioticophila]